MFTIGSLFSGIGGIELGLEMTNGFKTFWQVEINPYCRKVLAQYWPDVKRYVDIRSCGAHNLAPVDILVGGFPCQGISTAGKQRGIIHDSRSNLWFEYARLIRELRPRYVLIENVAALRFATKKHTEPAALEYVLSKLAECGYDAEWQVLSAAAFGAPHLRQRLFIVAYAHGARLRERSHLVRGQGERKQEYPDQPRTANAGIDGAETVVADPTRQQSGRLFQSDLSPDIGTSREDRATSMADTDGKRRRSRRSQLTRQPWPLPLDGRSASPGDMADPDGAGLSQPWQPRSLPETPPRGPSPTIFERGSQAPAWRYPQPADWWTVERPIRGMADGLSTALDNDYPNIPKLVHGYPGRVDELKALGNAVVPQIATFIGRQIIYYDALSNHA